VAPDDATAEPAPTDDPAVHEATSHVEQAPPDATSDDATAGEGATGAGTGSAGDADRFDLKGIVRQFATPMLESLDSRLREQVEAHVDALLTAKLDAALTDRLQTIDRAIAHLSRSVDELEGRVIALERGEAALDEAL
jgi:hypothetical protein